MPLLLIINDDGVDSPGIQTLARSVAPLGELRIVAPSGQRSWNGKAITRHDPIGVEEVERAGFAMLAVDGTPADCAQIGVHSRGPRPDVVLSGINIGSNAGSAYVLSSGTVGGALEASMAGVPAIAFSAASFPDWDEYNDYVLSDEATPYWDRMGDVCRRVLAAVLQRGFPDCDVLNINIPIDATEETPIRGSRVADTTYASIFSANGRGDGYVHDYQGLVDIEPAGDTDIATLMRGEVAATPLRLHFGSTPEPEFEDLFA